MVIKKIQKKYRTLIILSIITMGMFGFGYALVPLYDVFCKVTGINGRIWGAADPISAENTVVDTSRYVTVQFIATNNGQLPWTFEPMQSTVRLHPGEVTRVAFYAKNLTDKRMVVQAIPSVSPGYAAQYLRKTECFCFSQQTLASGESMEMPILFHLDKDLPADINTITLSYTLFDTQFKPSLDRGVTLGRI